MNTTKLLQYILMVDSIERARGNDSSYVVAALTATADLIGEARIAIADIQAENALLVQALEYSGREISALYKRVAELELAATGMVQL